MEKLKAGCAETSRVSAEKPKLLTLKGCIDTIKKAGWDVPVKSGCFFCPYAGINEFAELKKSNPNLFDKVVELERKTLERLVKNRMHGWFYEDMPLNKAVERKRPDTCDGQSFSLPLLYDLK